MDPCLTTPMSSGLERILYTRELFEMVLSCLPMKDLLFAQIVCRRWKAVVESSPTLQEALFFTPQAMRTTPSSPTLNVSTLYSDHFQYNSLLRAKFEPFFSKSARPYINTGSNHLLSMPWNKDEQSRAAYSRADASWRRMLVVQPASEIKHIEVLYMMHGRACDHLSTAGNSIDPIREGLRMGWVYDRCCERAFSHIGGFSLRWHMFKSGHLWAPKLTILLRHTIQCTQGKPQSEEWKAMWSQGYSRFKIDYRDHAWIKQAAEAGGNIASRSSRVPRHILFDAEDVEEF